MAILLGTAIGLALIYAVVALMCTAAQEFVSQALNLRSKGLSKALDSMMTSGPVKELLDLPMLVVLNRPGTTESSSVEKRMPSAITRELFSRAIVELGRRAFESSSTAQPDANNVKREEASKELHRVITAGGAEAAVADSSLDAKPAETDLNRSARNSALAEDGVKAVLQGLQQQGEMYKRLSPYLDGGVQTLADLRERIAIWFDDSMAGASEWYTRRNRIHAIALAFVLCGALNVDTLAITRTLWTQQQTRDAFVAVAGKLDLERTSDGAAKQLQNLANSLSESTALAALPLGWRATPNSIPAAGLNIVGLLVSALAVSLGSKFWFDALKGLISLRAGGSAAQEPPHSPQSK
jgi:hypothetical protein